MFFKKNKAKKREGPSTNVTKLRKLGLAEMRDSVFCNFFEIMLDK